MKYVKAIVEAALDPGRLPEKHWEQSKQIATQLLKVNEGFRGLPYDDATGKPLVASGKITIGYGRNLEAKPITKAEGLRWLHTEIMEIMASIQRTPMLAFVDKRKNPIITAGIMVMIYQLGLRGTLGFSKMLKALAANNDAEAAAEALDSAWSRQTPVRSSVVSQLFMGNFTPKP